MNAELATTRENLGRVYTHLRETLKNTTTFNRDLMFVFVGGAIFLHVLLELAVFPLNLESYQMWTDVLASILAKPEIEYFLGGPVDVDAISALVLKTLVPLGTFKVLVVSSLPFFVGLILKSGLLVFSAPILGMKRELNFWAVLYVLGFSYFFEWLAVPFLAQSPGAFWTAKSLFPMIVLLSTLKSLFGVSAWRVALGYSLYYVLAIFLGLALVVPAIVIFSQIFLG